MFFSHSNRFNLPPFTSVDPSYNPHDFCCRRMERLSANVRGGSLHWLGYTCERNSCCAQPSLPISEHFQIHSCNALPMLTIPTILVFKVQYLRDYKGKFEFLLKIFFFIFEEFAEFCVRFIFISCTVILRYESHLHLSIALFPCFVTSIHQLPPTYYYALV